MTSLGFPVEELVKSSDGSVEKFKQTVLSFYDRWLEEKHKDFDISIVYSLEKSLLLQTIDQMWKEHLQALDILKRGIGLRAYGQRDPLTEYKKESFALFEAMLSRVREQATILSSRAQLYVPEPEPIKTPDGKEIDFSNVGRNDPCPCGSGKKFKHCHGKVE